MQASIGRRRCPLQEDDQPTADGQGLRTSTETLKLCDAPSGSEELGKVLFYESMLVSKRANERFALRVGYVIQIDRYEFLVSLDDRRGILGCRGWIGDCVLVS